MKKYRIKYKDNYFAQEYKYITIIAETPQDANMFFFDNYSGVIFETEFMEWA